MDEINQKRIKIVIIGESRCGKSSIIQQYINKKFNESIESTIGVEFHKKHVLIDDKKVTLNILVTEGLNRWIAMNKFYYKDSDCCILCFDVNEEDPLRSLNFWKQTFLVRKLDVNPNFNTPFLVLGNKIDLVNKNNINRTVSKEMIESWCQTNSCSYLEVSAKNNISIDLAFDNAIRSALEYSENINPSKSNLINFNTINKTENSKCF